MRKAFDANVPKLKPRLRTSMVVVSDTAPATKDENTVSSEEQASTEPTVSAPEAFLKSNPEDTPESVYTGNATSGIMAHENTESVIHPEAWKNEHTTLAKKQDDDFEKNIVPFPNTAPEIKEVVESKDALPERSNLQEQENNLNNQRIVSEIPDVGDIDTADPQVQSLEDVNGAAHPELQQAQYDTVTASSEMQAFTIDNSDTRRKRIENLKRKVTEAVRPEIHIEPVPEDPSLAVESVLGLVSDLEAQLSRSREIESALRTELEEAKADLARTVGDERTVSERLLKAEAQLDEKRKVLEEMLFEMGALEEERDQAVRMVQMLTLKDKERQKEFDDVRQQFSEMQRALDESKVEEERLTDELDESSAENSRLHTLLTEITRERDTLLRDVELLSRERDELIDAKKALEKVHHALSQARARLRQ
jgi:DNA repair exonuclease SbcCD ATPase subunit